MLRTVSVPHEAASASRVRHRLAADLRECGLDEDAVRDAVLLGTELVGNAVRHARSLPDGTVRVTWQIVDGRVWLAVTDGGSGSRSPQQVAAAPDAVDGRGLSIVDSLAAVWGVAATEGATQVWVALPGDPAAESGEQPLARLAAPN